MMDFIKHPGVWKILLVVVLLVSFASGSFLWLSLSNQPIGPTKPSPTCPQPPRNVDPETLTLHQRTAYGYPPPGNPKLDKWIQLHGIHFCSDTDRITNEHN